MNKHQIALNEALKKLDQPRRKWPSCDGTKETHRQLLQRINWLRNKSAEAA